MRTIPNAIRLGGHTIKVVRRENLMNKADAYGTFDGAELEIAIDAGLEDSLVWETFWHEVVEALNFFSEADMEHKSIQVFGLLLHQVADSVLDHVSNKPSRRAAKRTLKGRVEG
jgi:hypothetical protein